MKRVLFISYVFPPMVAGGAPRVSQFAKYLPQCGWAPTVLTVPVSSGAAVDERALNMLSDDVEIVRAFCPLDRAAGRGGSYARQSLAGLGRRLMREAVRVCCIPDRQILWYPWAVRAGKQALRRQHYDAILATHGPATNLLIGARLSRWSGVPLVVDFRDLWADNPAPVWKTGLHRAISHRLERRVIRRAAKVIGVSENMAQYLAERHGRAASDVVSITNGFDGADRELVQDTRAGERNGRPFRLCYTGSVYGAYDLSSLFQAVKDLARDGKISPSDFRLEFVGNLAPEDPQHFGVAEFVDTRAAVPHDQVFDAFAAADALMLIEGPGYWGEYSYAVKLFDYLLTGKPILGLVEAGGNSARLLEAAGVGEIAHPSDRTAIRRSLERLLEAKGRPARAVDITRDPLLQFDRRYLTKRLAEVLNEAAALRPTEPGSPKVDR